MTFLSFQDVNGDPLTAEGLRMAITLPDDDGTECWIQARTFDLAGNTLPAFVRLEQMSTVAGNEISYRFSYRFGTNTGGDQTTVDGLAQNAVCLPLACNGFTIAFVEARMSFMPTTSASLIPVDFPPDTFLAMDNAPIIIGDMFSIEDVIDRSGAPLPFYRDLPMCRTNIMGLKVLHKPMFGTSSPSLKLILVWIVLPQGCATSSC